MSCNYAENLSHYEYKGELGLPEKFESTEEVQAKCQKLAEWLKESKHTVVHTGAGVSTAAGIPDFRGPNGVWTLEKEGKKPSINISWDDAKPTITHMALLSLQRAGYISYIVTQNIDGLHLRSGLPRSCLAELHGNFFVDKCNTCQKQFVRQGAVETVGLKTQGITCPGRRPNGRRCRGKLFDTILDWEDSLPDADLELSHMHSCLADLSLCLGTTLQIVPSGNLPVHTKKRGGKLVICNLQPTKQDKYADLIINTYVDDILQCVLKALNVPLLEYDAACDPVMKTRKQLNSLGYALQQQSPSNKILQLPGEFEPIDWSIPEEWVNDKDLINKFKSKKIIKRCRSSSDKNQKDILSNVQEKKAKIKKLKQEVIAKIANGSSYADKIHYKVELDDKKIKDISQQHKVELDDKNMEDKTQNKVKWDDKKNIEDEGQCKKEWDDKNIGDKDQCKIKLDVQNIENHYQYKMELNDKNIEDKSELKEEELDDEKIEDKNTTGVQTTYQVEYDDNTEDNT